MKSRHDFPSLNAKRPDGILPNGRPIRVFVVEDKEFQRKQIVQILESEGYKVVAVASNGKEALKYIDEHGRDIDVITSDLDMPILDGYAMLYEIKQKKLPAKVIFISDDPGKNIVAELIKMGADDFILKPVERYKILHRVKQSVDHK